ncbi:uncharacterized protein BXZ73DRAFT_91487 [Epithele typhae]|uniref:uncharacterized protein n=1 Tax=Epithele typhae TaxID=378194 RepID=UPI002008073E|nr:uncharacterized protein BXZ73DRAFT_91487 [Epithele typhae]KAH9923191.1 hypothetical protein BXZ73DRAFT_91487 [Epithele typhae]
MPRENSFSDSEGRSLTPDPEDGMATSPTWDGQTAERAPWSPPRRPWLTPPRSLAAPTSPARPTAYPSQTPKDRFRATVRKVMAMSRTSSLMARRGVGAEPGVDPRRASAFVNYGHIRQQCLIEVNDYSTFRTSFGRMTNAEFIRLLNDEGASKREPWVKVRWINIGGISWDVISALALKYDLHPLALEDVLTQRGHARSKTDYYPQHLFIRMLCHTLGAEEEATTLETTISSLPRSAADRAKFASMGHAGGLRYRGRRADVEQAGPTGARFGGMAESEQAQKNARNRKLVKELTRGDRVNVQIRPMCLFLFKDGTVISIHKDNTLNFTAPITERLRQRDTGLRTTADPSMLVQSLLDLVVDSAMEVVEEYQGRILKVEQAVLLKPSMKTVRRLHILQGDLILHKRTLEPIKTVIYGLRRYDVDRAMALREHADANVKEEGYMSHKAKIYLADVHDHMEYILTSLDMIAGITENLINYTFNMASYEMNEAPTDPRDNHFLPLTLLTGYFGMNFDPMWSVMENSDLLFWEIALPLMAVVIPLFLFNDFKRMAHYIEKRLTRRAVVKSFKRA